MDTITTDTYDRDFEEIRKSFLETIPEKIEDIEGKLLDLESDQSPDAIKQIVRALMSALHSLKGSSAAHEFNFISKVAHYVEDCIETIRDSESKSIQNNVSSYLEFLDLIKTFANEYETKTRSKLEETYLQRYNSKTRSQIQSQHQVSILFIELLNTVTKSMRESLRSLGYDITHCRTNIEGLQRIMSGEKFDFIVCSEHQSGLKGSSLAAVLKLEYGKIRPTIILTSSSNVVSPYEKLKPDHLVPKGTDLATTLANIFKQKRKIESA